MVWGAVGVWGGGCRMLGVWWARVWGAVKCGGGGCGVYNGGRGVCAVG